MSEETIRAMCLRGCGLQTGFIRDLDSESWMRGTSDIITPGCKANGCHYRGMSGECDGGSVFEV